MLSDGGFQFSPSQAEWRPLFGRGPVKYWAMIGWDHGVATPALSCYKDTAQGTQRPLPGRLWEERQPADYGHFLPFAVSLWHKGGFNLRKGSLTASAFL